MHEELKQSMPVFSYAGYACAISTGVIRLMKSRHWLKDVVAGAIIGVACAKLAYVGVKQAYRLVKNRKTAPDQASGISGSTSFASFSSDSCHPR